jgi:polyisoprenoid-binding protein YceI
MKKVFYSIFAVAALSMTSCGAAEETGTEGGEGKDSTKVEEVAISGTYNTAEGASIVWKAKHDADEDFVHVGTVQTAGNIVVDNNTIVGGEFTFDLTTIDENGDTDYTKMLEAHFQDSTMFNVMKYASATFTVSGSEAGKIMGNLVVLGVTQPITLEGELTVTDTEVAFVGTSTVDMLGFGMPLLIMSEQAPEDKKGQSPDPKVVIDIDLKLTK